MSDEEAVYDSSFPESVGTICSDLDRSFNEVVRRTGVEERIFAIPERPRGFPCTFGSGCKKILKTERGLKCHMKIHRIKDAAAHRITGNELLEASSGLAEDVLQQMSKLEADGPPGVAVQECCVLLLLSQDGAEWEELVKEIAEQIVFNCVPEKFSSPTAAYGEVKVQVHNLIMNDAFREVFFSKFNALGISVDVETVARFMGMFLRRFAHEISGALFRTMRRPEVGSSNPVQQPLTSRQKSLYHYVAGSAVKTLLRKGLLLRKAKNPKWTRIVNCLHTCFQETGANDSHQSEAHQWTSVIDRGGLTYVGEKAMEFFYLCGSIAKQVKPPSRYKFFEQVYQCKELVYMWEELVSDMLPADESSWLMEQLCRLFYNTYCKGYCNKARNEQLDKKSQACVSTRQRLARE